MESGLEVLVASHRLISAVRAYGCIHVYNNTMYIQAYIHCMYTPKNEVISLGFSIMAGGSAHWHKHLAFLDNFTSCDGVHVYTCV